MIARIIEWLSSFFTERDVHMPDTGTIVNSQQEGRRPLIATTSGGTDILNSLTATADPAGIVAIFSGAPDEHYHVQAVAEGTVLIEVQGLGSFAALTGSMNATVTADDGGPGGLTLTFGDPLPKV